jgi:hypothetical protein
MNAETSCLQYEIKRSPFTRKNGEKFKGEKINYKLLHPTDITEENKEQIKQEIGLIIMNSITNASSNMKLKYINIDYEDEIYGRDFDEPNEVFEVYQKEQYPQAKKDLKFEEVYEEVLDRVGSFWNDDNIKVMLEFSLVFKEL